MLAFSTFRNSTRNPGPARDPYFVEDTTAGAPTIDESDEALEGDIHDSDQQPAASPVDSSYTEGNSDDDEPQDNGIDAYHVCPETHLSRDRGKAANTEVCQQSTSTQGLGDKDKGTKSRIRQERAQTEVFEISSMKDNLGHRSSHRQSASPLPLLTPPTESSNGASDIAEIQSSDKEEDWKPSSPTTNGVSTTPKSREAHVPPKTALDGYDDPSFETYRGKSTPISPVSGKVIKKKAEDIHAITQWPMDVATQYAERMEEVFRLRRWARYFGIKTDPAMFDSATTEQLTKAVRQVEAWRIYHPDRMPSREFHEIVETHITSPQERDADSNKRILVNMNISKINFRRKGSPCSESNVQQLFSYLGVAIITNKRQQQIQKAKVMQKWWEEWAPSDSSKAGINNPFTGLRRRVVEFEFIHLGADEFDIELVNLAIGSDPKLFHFDMKNMGWPGFEDFESVLTDNILKLYKTVGISSLSDDRIQKCEGLFEFARLFVPEPIWLEAFRSGRPTSLRDLIDRVYALHTSIQFTQQSLYESYGILSKGGLIDNVFNPRYNKVNLNEAAKETIPNNAMSSLFPHFRPVTDSGAPLYLVNHETKKRSQTDQNAPLNVKKPRNNNGGFE